MTQTATRLPAMHTVGVTVNGTHYSREVEPRQLLVYFVREQLGLTGTSGPGLALKSEAIGLAVMTFVGGGMQYVKSLFD